jgi:hypothetical protein
MIQSVFPSRPSKSHAYMRRSGLKHWIPFFTVLAFLPLLSWAGPGTLENLQFKVTLSETSPGVDDSLIPGVDPLINVDVQDKIRGTGTRYPLKAYAITEYFFSDNLLNLITRNSPKSSLTKPLYGFLQLNLEAPDQSRQYSGFRKYYFSTDNRALLALFEQGEEGGPVTQSLGLVRWSDKPASLGWIYSPGNQVNALRAAQVPDGETPALEGTVGWTADSLTCAFVASFSGGPATPNPATKTYFLIRVDMGEVGIKVAASPVDPAALRLDKGATIDKVDCSGDKATLTIVSPDGTDTQQVELPLPSSSNGPSGP